MHCFLLCQYDVYVVYVEYSWNIDNLPDLWWCFVLEPAFHASQYCLTFDVKRAFVLHSGTDSLHETLFKFRSFICIYMCEYIYIYIYITEIESERERERYDHQLFVPWSRTNCEHCQMPLLRRTDYYFASQPIVLIWACTQQHCKLSLLFTWSVRNPNVELPCIIYIHT